jgi:hypothetical protein
MLARCRVASLLALICCFGPSILSAAESSDDHDLHFQGEYAGSVVDAHGCCLWTGLHVVALGDGAFQAVEYRGGLPGNGWDKTTRTKLNGKLVNGELKLEGEGNSISIRGDRANCSGPNGHERGRLQKFNRFSQTLGAPAPVDATILFDGTNTNHFTNGKITSDGLLSVGTDTKRSYRDFTMHLEFRTPWMPAARGQGRGNSGVYIQGRYEVQILDSFGLDGVDNECGALYKAVPPRINMCFPPMTWQTYDIDFTAPRFDQAGKKTKNAVITVRHNGIYVHHHREIPNKTGGGAVEGPDARPIKLQNHNNPVHFRNIWIVERDGPAPPHEFIPSPPYCPEPWRVTWFDSVRNEDFIRPAALFQVCR